MNNIKALVKKLGLDEKTAVYIENPLNLHYLTGTAIDTGCLVITAEKSYFITDFRYIETANNYFCNSDVNVVMQQKLTDDIKNILDGCKIEKLLIESDFQHISRMAFFKNVCKCVITDGSLDNAVNSLRAIKQPYEIEQMKAAQKLTDGAFTHILPYIKPDVKERDIALEMEFFMRKNGAEGVSFDLITITGKKTSMPHGVPSNDLVKSGDFFTMDIGCKVGGYCSDMTRTVAIGSVSNEMRKVYNTVLEAQSAVLDMLKAGVVCSDADKVARDIIYGAGYQGCFGHATGHSVGLFIHETPTLSPSCSEILESGMVETVEPGIYLANLFGVRIEDMVLIQNDGIYDFTQSTKELIIL